MARDCATLLSLRDNPCRYDSANSAACGDGRRKRVARKTSYPFGITKKIGPLIINAFQAGTWKVLAGSPRRGDLGWLRPRSAVHPLCCSDCEPSLAPVEFA